MDQITHIKQQNLLCEFQNNDEQEYFSIKKDIFIESERSLKHESTPNPNKPFRLTRDTYSNYVTLMRCVKNLQAFLRNYKEVLVTNAQRKRLASIQNPTPQDEAIRLQLQQASLPLIINKIVLLKQKQQKQAITYAINKLKCMVVKARYKQSTTLQHLTQTYISKLKNILIYQVRYKQQKGQKHKIIELQSIRNEFILKSIELIKRKYEIIHSNKLNKYKIQPRDYLRRQKNGLLQQKPIFFINLYTQSLLFVGQEYIKFNQFLLYCPIVLIQSKTLKISDQYHQVINMTNNQWNKFQIYAEVYHIQTISNVPIFYSKLKQLTPNDLHFDKIVAGRLQQETKRLQQMLNCIDSIKKCVFSQMILHWLSYIFNQQQKSIEVIIQQKFKVVFRATTEIPAYIKMNSIESAIYKPEILANILIVAGDSKNVQKGRKQLKQIVRSQLQATIFKMIAEKVGVRVSWPLQCNSIGHYYYEYNSDRILNRGEVKNYYNQF